MLERLKKMLITFLGVRGSLGCMVKVSNCTKCISLNNQLCMARAMVINLNPNKHNQGLHHYPLMVSLDRCNGSCNTLNDLSSKICVPKKSRKIKSL